MVLKEDLNYRKNIVQNSHCVLLTDFFHFVPHFGNKQITYSFESNVIVITLIFLLLLVCLQNEQISYYYHCYIKFLVSSKNL